jgi:DNA (cytosine-5)-methyltransferase 1
MKYVYKGITMYRVLDLFSGIGGFSLGLERTRGFETVAFCEIEKFPQKVLTKHWPSVPIYEDVRNVTREGLAADGIFPNVITGGFPCQDISVAGNQKGINSETRSGLWSECARLVGEIRPDYAIFENVTALLSGDSGRWFQRVLFDISEVGYDAEWHCIPASELGANHHRDRVWIIAYPAGRRRTKRRERAEQQRSGACDNGQTRPMADSAELQRNGSKPNAKNGRSSTQKPQGSNCSNNMADTDDQGLQGSAEPGIFKSGRAGWQELIARCFRGFPEISAVEPTICGTTNGIPNRAHRLKGLGNAVVPQIPELIGRAILESQYA